MKSALVVLLLAASAWAQAVPTSQSIHALTVRYQRDMARTLELEGGTSDREAKDGKAKAHTAMLAKQAALTAQYKKYLATLKSNQKKSSK